MSLRFARWPGLVLLMGTLVAVGFVPTVSAAPSPRYYERLVASDTEGDYDSNGALDIVAVHLSERYSYSSATRSGLETVEFRIELRDRNQIRTLPPDRTNGSSVFLTPIEYTLGFTLGGESFVHEAILVQECEVSASEEGAGLDCNNIEPVIDEPHYSTARGGVTFVFYRALRNLSVGAPISHVWAASALVPQGEKSYQDAAPKDNEQRPEGSGLATPTTGDETFALLGTYPFLTADLLGGAERFAPPGGTAAFVVEFRTHDNVTDVDHVYIDGAGPAGWTYEGNIGTDFIMTNGGQRVEYEFRVKVPAVATVGERATVTIHAALQGAGGHVQIPVDVVIASGKIEAPQYAFVLQSPGPFKAEETSTLAWRVAFEGEPLVNYRLAADFVLNGRVVNKDVPASEKEPGLYEVVYTFPMGGAWTADIYVAELSPSPHATFPVEVASAKGGLLPGLELWGALASLATVVALGRRV